MVEQDGAVAEIGGELAAGQALQTVGVVRDRDDLGRDLGSVQRLAQAGFRGAAGEHADLLAGQLLETGGTVDRIEQRRAGSEGEQREVHLGPAREGHGRGLAQDVGLAVRHGVSRSAAPTSTMVSFSSALPISAAASRATASHRATL